MENKILSMLGLARRANKVILGLDNIIKYKARCKILVLAADASDRTKRNATDLELETISLQLTKAEIGRALGCEGVAVLGVTDSEFANAVRKLSQD